jgi:CHAD domain-containing protein
MAKAADIEVRPWEPYARAGARIVRVRTEELFGHAEGVLDTEDIERVHDMRVATRRLRAVLEIFAPCFPPGGFKGALRDVKALADALGERRDPDVHVAALEAFAAAVPAADRAGVRELAERQRARQAAGNARLAAALEQVRRSDLRVRLLALADAADAELAQ